jgi:hypothetical protein
VSLAILYDSLGQLTDRGIIRREAVRNFVRREILLAVDDPGDKEHASLGILRQPLNEADFFTALDESGGFGADIDRTSKY